MSEQSDLLEEARAVSIKATVENLRIIHNLRKSRTDGCTSDPAPAGHRDGGATRPTDRKLVGDLLFDLARFHLNNLDGLLNLSARHTDRVIDRIKRQNEPRTSSSPVVTRPALSLAGTSGDVASGSFLITNQRKRAIRVDFLVSEFCEIDAREPFSAEVSFSAQHPCPARDPRCLEAGESRYYSVKILLDPAKFSTGKRYASSIMTKTENTWVDEIPLSVEVR